MFTKSAISFAGKGVLIGAMFPSLLFAGQLTPHPPGLEKEAKTLIVRYAAPTKRSVLPHKKNQQTLLAKQQEQRSAATVAAQPLHSSLHTKSHTTAKVMQVAKELSRAKKRTQAKTRLSSTASKLISVREQLLRQSSPKQRVKRAALLSSTQQASLHFQSHHTPTADVVPLGTFTMRAYTHPRPQAEALSKTASGTAPEPGRTVAVDPRIIPLGTRIYIPGLGERIAEDIGRRIKGKRLDVFLPTVQHCRHFGVQTREVMALIE